MQPRARAPRHCRKRRHRRGWPLTAASLWCWTRRRQGRQDRSRPDEAKASHNQQASQAEAGFKGPRGPRWPKVGSLFFGRCPPASTPNAAVLGKTSILLLFRNTFIFFQMRSYIYLNAKRDLHYFWRCQQQPRLLRLLKKLMASHQKWRARFCYRMGGVGSGRHSN